jgi:hypothetical protein
VQVVAEPHETLLRNSAECVCSLHDWPPSLVVIVSELNVDPASPTTTQKEGDPHEMLLRKSPLKDNDALVHVAPASEVVARTWSKLEPTD